MTAPDEVTVMVTPMDEALSSVQRALKEVKAAEALVSKVFADGCKELDQIGQMRSLLEGIEATWKRERWCRHFPTARSSR